MKDLQKKLQKHFFWKHAFADNNSLFLQQKPSVIAERIQVSVKAFYALIFLLAFQTIGRLNVFKEVTLVDPLWPVKWILELDDTLFVIKIIHLVFIGIALLTAIFPHIRILRIALFTSLLEYSAVTNSFGKIDHGWHLLMIVSFIFCFLSSKSSRNSSFKSMVVFASAQFMVLLTYSMSGLWKLIEGVKHWMANQPSIFSLDSLSNQIANRLLQTNSRSFVGEYLIYEEHIGFVMMASAVFLELFSLFVFFKARLQRIWGISLILMHFGIYLAMTIGFTNSVIVVGVLFVFSPFQKNQPLLTLGTLADLPIVGNLFIAPEIMSKNKKSILFYDASCGVCSKLIQFLLRKASAQNIQFAPIGGKTYNSTFNEEISIQNFDSIIYLNQDSGDYHIQSRAIWLALSHCSAPYSWMAALYFIPKELSDIGYSFFAKIRKRIFGSNCMLLSPEEQELFLVYRIHSTVVFYKKF